MIGLIAFAAVLAAPFAAKGYSAQCSYWSAKGGFYQGACLVSPSADIRGPYRETVIMPNKSVRLIETGRQGQWATYTIDGKAGVRIEIDRETYRYSTLTLDMSLEVGAGQ